MSEEMESMPMGMAPGFSGHNSEGSLKYQTENIDVLADLERSLKCEVWIVNSITGKATLQIPEGVVPLINSRGVNNIMASLRIRLSKVFILSDFDAIDVEKMTLNVGNIIISDLLTNWDAYDIKDMAAASTVVALVSDTVYATLRKGMQATYLKYLQKTHSTTEMQTHSHRPRQVVSPESGGGGAFGKLFKRR